MDLYAFKASLVYRASSRVVKATQRNSVSKKQTETNKTKKTTEVRDRHRSLGPQSHSAQEVTLRAGK